MENEAPGKHNKLKSAATCRREDPYASLYRALLMMAKKLTTDADMAHDLAGECFVSLLEKAAAEGLNCLPGSDHAVFQLVQEQYNDQLRLTNLRERAAAVFLYELQASRAPFSLWMQERQYELLQLTPLLPLPGQTVIELNLVCQWDLESIAAFTGKPASTVKIIRNRAVVHLRKLVARRQLFQKK